MLMDYFMTTNLTNQITFSIVAGLMLFGLHYLLKYNFSLGYTRFLKLFGEIVLLSLFVFVLIKSYIIYKESNVPGGGNWFYVVITALFVIFKMAFDIYCYYYPFKK